MPQVLGGGGLAVKSIRTNPRTHAPEGDERIRTAEQGLGADPVYELLAALREIHARCVDHNLSGTLTTLDWVAAKCAALLEKHK